MAELLHLNRVSYGIAGNLYPSALAFLFVPLLTFALTPEEYGTLTYVTSVIAFSTSLVGLGLNSYLLKVYEHNRYQRSNFIALNSIFWVSCLVALIANIIIFFLVSFGLLDTSIRLVDLAIFIVGVVFLSTIALVPQAFLILRGKMVHLFWLIFLTTSLEYFLIYWLVLEEELGVEGKLISRLFACGLFLISLIAIFRKILFKRLMNWQVIRSAVAFGPNLAIASILYLLIDLSDKIILEMFISLDELGLYGIGLGIAFVLMSLSRGINVALQAPVVEAAKEKIEKRLIVRILVSQRTINSVMFPAATILLCVAIILTGWFFEPAYSQSRNYALLLIPIPIIYAHQHLFLSVLIARGESSFFFRSAVLGVVTNIILNLLLIPKLGVYGSIIATYCAYSIMLVVCYSGLKKISGCVPFSRDFFLHSIAITAALAAVCLGFIESFAAVVLTSATAFLVSILIIKRFLPREAIWNGKNL